jgi:glucosamine-6-phosphate deaminase
MTLTDRLPRLMLADRADASRQAAELLAHELIITPHPVLGLATGSSVEAVYRELAAMVADSEPLRTGVDRAEAFALDEYLGLPDDDPHTYRATLRRQLAEPIGLPEERLHVPDPDPTVEPAGYDRAIAAAGGIGVQLLGIGANGHIGFNEPGAALDSRTRVVDLTDRTRRDNARFFARPELVPTRAVTQGIGTILGARRLVVLAFGAAKADALAAALTGPIDPAVPASALRLHPDVVVLADRPAASAVLDLFEAGLDRL